MLERGGESRRGREGRRREDYGKGRIRQVRGKRGQKVRRNWGEVRERKGFMGGLWQLGSLVTSEGATRTKTKSLRKMLKE